MSKADRILRQTVGDGRTAQEKKTDHRQKSEGMTTKGSSVEKRKDERK